ncbi:MAG: hypothetical protein ACXWYB_13350, partial [Aeromicrobium sp.]
AIEGLATRVAVRLRRPPPQGVRAYWKNASFARLDDGLIATLVEQVGAQTWYGTAADPITWAANSAQSPRMPRPFRTGRRSIG